MKIFYVSYSFRWDFVGVTLFAKDKLDAQQKADNYLFNKSKYNMSQKNLRDFEVEELVPDDNGVIDSEHFSHD